MHGLRGVFLERLKAEARNGWQVVLAHGCFGVLIAGENNEAWAKRTRSSGLELWLTAAREKGLFGCSHTVSA